MKAIIFYLLLIPIIGLAQPETESLNSFRKETFYINNYTAKSIEATLHTNALVSSFLSTANENKMLLDSMYQVSYNYNSDTSSFIREYYKYDERGNQVLLTYLFPCEGCASSSHKIETIFDENGNRTIEVMYAWDFAAKQWIKVRKTVFTFDDKGRLTNIIEYMWLENGTEINPAKTDLSYDDHTNVLLKVRMRYDLNTNEWIGNVKDEYAYKNDRCILHIFYEWDKSSGQWKNVSKYEGEYDENGNQTLSIDYNWDGLTNRWAISNSYKSIYTYSPNGKMTNVTNFTWDKSTSQWNNQRKADFTIDLNDHEVLRIISGWDTHTNQWVGETKYETLYNEKEQLTSYIVFSWNKINNAWDSGGKVDFEYDQEGNNTTKTDYHWDPIKKELWIREISNYYYYSLHDLTDAVDVNENSQVNLYPNPVHEAFTLEINDRSVAQCQIFNSNGQLIKTLAVQMGVNTYDISNLKEGLYLVSIKTEKGVIVKKIVKK